MTIRADAGPAVTGGTSRAGRLAVVAAALALAWAGFAGFSPARPDAARAGYLEPVDADCGSTGTPAPDYLGHWLRP